MLYRLHAVPCCLLSLALFRLDAINLRKTDLEMPLKRSHLITDNTAIINIPVMH